MSGEEIIIPPIGIHLNNSQQESDCVSPHFFDIEIEQIRVNQKISRHIAREIMLGKDSIRYKALAIEELEMQINTTIKSRINLPIRIFIHLRNNVAIGQNIRN